jgi:hypothetical protein
MRKELQKIEEERKRFRGTVLRYGKKSGFKGRTDETILLRDVVDVSTGHRITDHLWLNLTKQFADLQLQEGDCVEFDARVKAYVKGYVNRLGAIDNRKKDFHLSHPTRVKKSKPNGSRNE